MKENEAKNVPFGNGNSLNLFLLSFCSSFASLSDRIACAFLSSRWKRDRPDLIRFSEAKNIQSNVVLVTCLCLATVDDIESGEKHILRLIVSSAALTLSAAQHFIVPKQRRETANAAIKRWQRKTLKPKLTTFFFSFSLFSHHRIDETTQRDRPRHRRFTRKDFYHVQKTTILTEIKVE